MEFIFSGDIIFAVKSGYQFFIFHYFISIFLAEGLVKISEVCNCQISMVILTLVLIDAMIDAC